jgi:uncharacterized protein (TIGR02145 family)
MKKFLCLSIILYFITMFNALNCVAQNNNLNRKFKKLHDLHSSINLYCFENRNDTLYYKFELNDKITANYLQEYLQYRLQEKGESVVLIDYKVKIIDRQAFVLDCYFLNEIKHQQIVENINKQKLEEQNKLKDERIIKEKQKQGKIIVDDRDDNVYTIARIGTHVWMTQDLKYENNESLKSKDGVLYKYQNALRVCPSGWTLPSRTDYETAILNGGTTIDNYYNARKEYQFNATFNGRWIEHGTSGGSKGTYWTSTNILDLQSQQKYVYVYIDISLHGSRTAYFSEDTRNAYAAVRCVKHNAINIDNTSNHGRIIRDSEYIRKNTAYQANLTMNKQLYNIEHNLPINATDWNSNTNFILRLKSNSPNISIKNLFYPKLLKKNKIFEEYNNFEFSKTSLVLTIEKKYNYLYYWVDGKYIGKIDIYTYRNILYNDYNKFSFLNQYYIGVSRIDFDKNTTVNYIKVDELVFDKNIMNSIINEKSKIEYSNILKDKSNIIKYISFVEYFHESFFYDDVITLFETELLKEINIIPTLSFNSDFNKYLNYTDYYLKYIPQGKSKFMVEEVRLYCKAYIDKKLSIYENEYPNGTYSINLKKIINDFNENKRKNEEQRIAKDNADRKRQQDLNSSFTIVSGSNYCRLENVLSNPYISTPHVVIHIEDGGFFSSNVDANRYSVNIVDNNGKTIGSSNDPFKDDFSVLASNLPMTLSINYFKDRDSNKQRNITIKIYNKGEYWFKIN